MCGLAGIFSYKSTAPAVDQAELLYMRDQMIARGPDGAGLWISADQRVGLAHRRLSIIDLSERGAQPMVSGDGQFFIVFNGEIYNYQVLRTELEHQGYQFRSTSDTEVLLALYSRKREIMLSDLRGMFAFAIWDAMARSLFVARDAYGIKPLYYADDARTFRVASQVKALQAGGALSVEPDPAGIVGFYLFGSVPEPFTAWAAVKALPAGTWLQIDEGGVKGPFQWHNIANVWRDALHSAPAGAGVEEEAASIAESVRDSVRHHLVADVPVGAFLSAGIDSGALLGLMVECGQVPHALTLAFSEFRDQAQDESPLAALVATGYGVSHSINEVTEQQFAEDWPRLLESMDQPSIDGVNTWYVSQAARAVGLKVAISGLGGDELFGGYPSFRDLPRWRHWLGPLASIPGLGRCLRRLGSSVTALLGQGCGHVSPKALSLIEYAGTWPGVWLLRRGLFMPWELPALIGEELAREGLARLAPLELIRAATTPDPDTDFGRVAALEASLYMRNQLLRDADWAGMAHGLEIRVPLVDTELLRRVAPLVLRTDPHTKSAKQALATAPRKPLPDQVRNRPKTGFSMPFAHWLERIDGLDSWRRVPQLARPGCHWSRRMAYALLNGQRGG